MKRKLVLYLVDGHPWSARDALNHFYYGLRLCGGNGWCAVCGLVIKPNSPYWYSPTEGMIHCGCTRRVREVDDELRT